MKARQLSIIAGASYLIIFFLAIFANFFVIESLKVEVDALDVIQNNSFLVRCGIMAFIITVVFDVVIAWALRLLYPENPLTSLSTYFRMMHAAIMAVAVFTLPIILKAQDSSSILFQIELFETIWLIGLFFFGIHLILLSRILEIPSIIAVFLTIAGIMYMVDTTAHFMMANYEAYSSIFLGLVAAPSIIGEMSLAIWLLIKGGKKAIS